MHNFDKNSLNIKNKTTLQALENLEDKINGKDIFFRGDLDKEIS